MSYVIDVYRGEQKPARGFLEYFAFVSFFPTLLAGPITRARVLLTQLQQPAAALTDEQGSRALMMIARGFIKKLVFADYLSVNLVDRAFELPRMFSSLEILIAVYAFAVQIYCDFSGYSDIAIGVAQLLGFRLPDNFNSPLPLGIAWWNSGGAGTSPFPPGCATIFSSRFLPAGARSGGSIGIRWSPSPWAEFGTAPRGRF